MILKEQNNQKKTLTDGVLAVNHEQENTPSTNGKRSSDGSLSHEEDLAKVIELQEVIDKQAERSYGDSATWSIAFQNWPIIRIT